MRYMGAVWKKKQAMKDGARLAKDSGHTVVIEKAKCKDKGKYKVCYRAWVELRRNIPEVITYQEWKELRRYL